MLVQVAGIKTVKDAIMCANAGVDFAGLLIGKLHNSEDFITNEEARKIADSLPDSCKPVMITHLENSKEIIDSINITNIQIVQLHSHIKETEVEKIKKACPNIVLWRLIHIGENGEVLTDYENMKYVNAFFFDSINTKTNQVGGTGLIHDWNVTKQLSKKLTKPIILAGGLTHENVIEAINFVKPYAVDVNSGTKAKNGLRDKKKVRLFVKAAKSCNIS